MKFSELALNENLLEAISYMGFDEATPIQQQAIPKILAGNDLLACAQTGTGKTAAFLLPLLHHLLELPDEQKIQALVLVPTRELALQIDKQTEGIAYFSTIDSAPIYGGGDGEDWEQQKKALIQGAKIIVATPGKLISHLSMGYVNFASLKYLILDEADKMLDIGFHDDILKIISHLPTERQTLMFSATMPPKIRTFAKKILQNPEEININVSKPAEGVLQACYHVHDDQKIPVIHSLIKNKPDYKSILIFTSTKKNVGEIARSLKRNNYDVEGISSDLEQDQREEILLQFRAKQVRVLVATDVLSRGIDIKDIELIINYDVPGDPEDYVHRVGRTARASSTGVAITFVNQDDIIKFKRIERFLEKPVLRIPVPSEYGESPVWEESSARGQRSGRPFKRQGKRKNFKK